MTKAPSKAPKNASADGVQWPADKVERWPIGRLKPFTRNARTHSPEQINQIVAAIKEWGWTNPILAQPDGTIIAGHGRHAAALQLGLAEVPVMVARGWTDAQTRAYVLADNQIALNAGWDEELLRLELGDLTTEGFDLSLAGFDEVALAKALGEELDGDAEAPGKTLMERFGVAPFSVLSARDGWWQDRKRAWLALGIQSELGRGENPSCFDGAIKANATPGGSPRSAADYRKTRARGDGAGRAVA